MKVEHGLGFSFLQHQEKNVRVSYFKAVKFLANSTLSWCLVLEAPQVKFIIIRNENHDY